MLPVAFDEIFPEPRHRFFELERDLIAVLIVEGPDLRVGWRVQVAFDLDLEKLLDGPVVRRGLQSQEAFLDEAVERAPEDPQAVGFPGLGQSFGRLGQDGLARDGFTLDRRQDLRFGLCPEGTGEGPCRKHGQCDRSKCLHRWSPSFQDFGVRRSLPIRSIRTPGTRTEPSACW